MSGTCCQANTEGITIKVGAGKKVVVHVSKNVEKTLTSFCQAGYCFLKSAKHVAGTCTDDAHVNNRECFVVDDVVNRCRVVGEFEAKQSTGHMSCNPVRAQFLLSSSKNTINEIRKNILASSPLLRQALSSITTATDNVTMMGLSYSSTLSRTYLRHKRYSLG